MKEEGWEGSEGKEQGRPLHSRTEGNADRSDLGRYG